MSYANKNIDAYKDKDLNIYNYDYLDMLTLFSIDHDFSNHSLTKLEQKIRTISDSFPSIYHPFFTQAYKLVKSVYLLHSGGALHANELDKIDAYIKKIQQIPSYESLDVETILEKLDININIGDAANSRGYQQQSRGQKQSIYNNRTRQPSSIKEPETVNTVQSSYPNVIAPGSLNSIKRITQFLNLNLNTCFRTNYYNSNPCDFQYFLPVEIKHVVSMRLASIEIPNSWYVFSSAQKNNAFMIEINNNGVITPYDIIIPDGNYDNETLQYFLNHNYFFLSGNFNDLVNIEFTIDPINFKSSFKSLWVLPSLFRFTIHFYQGTQDASQNIMSTIGWAMGFRLASYNMISAEILSEGLFDAGSDRYIYVSIDDYQNNHNSLNVVCFDNSVMEQNIIAKIPMINGKLSLIIEDNNSPLSKNRRYNGPVNIRNMHVRILDRFGSVINLNNMDYSFTLELEILYEGFNFKDVNA